MTGFFCLLIHLLKPIGVNVSDLFLTRRNAKLVAGRHAVEAAAYVRVDRKSCKGFELTHLDAGEDALLCYCDTNFDQKTTRVSFFIEVVTYKFRVIERLRGSLVN